MIPITTLDETIYKPLETFGHISLEERIKVIAKAWVFYGGNRVDLFKSYLKIIEEVRSVDGYVIPDETEEDTL